MTKKFDFKRAFSSMPNNARDAGVAIAGMVISRKFIDAGKLIKNPDNFIVKNQGLAKLALGLFGMSAMSDNPWVRNLSFGVALEGGFTALRQMTSKKEADGSVTYLVDQIGKTDTLQESSSVAGQDDDGSEGIQNAVSGMGAEDIEPIDD